jgi:hypothetical protein
LAVPGLAPAGADAELGGVRFVKRENGVVEVVEEVRNSRRYLAFKTMHRYPEGGHPGEMNAPSGAPGGPSILRPKPTPGEATGTITPAGLADTKRRSTAMASCRESRKASFGR